MGWPEDPMLARLECAWGADLTADPDTWDWTDETAYWHIPDDVTIKWGWEYRGTKVMTSEFSIGVKNTTGRFTARDPRGELWPYVVKYTPVRWSVSFDNGATWYVPFGGYIRKLPTRWPGNSGRYALATIAASGILYRLDQGTQPRYSPLRRDIAASPTLAGYWPAEDGVSAGQIASAVPGNQPMITIGTVGFASVADYIPFDQATRYGTASLADLSAGGGLRVDLPPTVTAATVTAHTIHCTAAVDPAEISGDMVLAEWATPGGSFVRWQLVVTASSRTQVIAYTATSLSGSVVIDRSSASPGFIGRVVRLNQAGVNIAVGLYLSSDTVSNTGSITGTLAGVTTLAVNPGGVTSDTAVPVGHYAIWAAATPQIQLGAATDSYGGAVTESRRSHLGEAACDRLARLCAEAGVRLTMTPPTTLIVRMGWQPVASFRELVDQCVAADGGFLREDGFGLSYTPREALFNPDVVLTIDAAARELGAPFEPDDEPKGTNTYTASRTDGSSVTVTNANADRIGPVPDGATLNLSSDALLLDQAGWGLHLAQVDEPGYPSIKLRLDTNPHLLADWLDVVQGSRMQIIHPPDQHGPYEIDQLVMGAVETYRGRRLLDVDMVGAPASPWRVAVEGDPAAAEGSVLAEVLAAGAMSLLLGSTYASGPWTQDPAHWPLTLLVGGERVTATGAAPALLDDFGRTVVAGLGTTTSGQVYSIAGGSASDFAVSSGVGRITNSTVGILRSATVPLSWRGIILTADVSWAITSANTAPVTWWQVAGSDLLNYYAAVLSLTTTGSMTLTLYKRVAGALTVLAAATPAGAHTGGNAWRLTLTQDGTTVRGIVRNQTAGGPTTTITGTDADPALVGGGSIVGFLARAETGNTNTTPVVSFDAFVSTTPQRVTLSGRTLDRAWPAGTPVNVWPVPYAV